MGQSEMRQESANAASVGESASAAVATSAATSVGAAVAPQQGQGAAARSCPSCGNSGATVAVSFIYALGRIEPRFPRLSVEKEFAQVTGRTDTAGLTDRQVLHSLLSKPENRYLARQLCWVLTIEGLETYMLVPRDPVDFQLLVES